jgi:hypothetical protein
MRLIPPKIKKELADNPVMSCCCYPDCNRHDVQWHHPYRYSGRQIVEAWGTVPACMDHHKAVKTDRQVKEFFEWYALRRADIKDLQARYPRFGWELHKRRLDGKFIYRGGN